MLHAQAVLRHARRRVIGIFAVRPLREQRRGCRSARLPVVAGIAQLDVACRGCVFERSAAGDVVDVVALLALKECAKAAAKDGLAIAREVIGETDARLIGLDTSC